MTNNQRLILNKKKINDYDVTHPKEKMFQIDNVLYSYKRLLSIVEFHGGKKNLSKLYKFFSNDVHEIYDNRYNYYDTKGNYIDGGRFDEDYKGGVDSYKLIDIMSGLGRTFDVVDIDDFGYPWLAFPNVFNLVSDGGVLFLTMPTRAQLTRSKVTYETLKHHNVLGDNEKLAYIKYFQRKARDRNKFIQIKSIIKLSKHMWRFAIIVNSSIRPSEFPILSEKEI